MGDAAQIDRDWYEQSEGGACLDLTVQVDDVGGAESTVQKRKPTHQEHRQPDKKWRYSERHQQNLQDTDRWEQQVFQQTGLLAKPLKPSYDPATDPDHATKAVQLVVHERHPPFIEKLLARATSSPSSPIVVESDASLSSTSSSQLGTIAFDPVQPVRDSTSDMAKLARLGSKLVAEMRSRKEQQKLMRALTKGDHQDGNEDEGATTKTSNAIESYQDALSKVGKVEDGSRSMSAERRALPVYSVRSQLLKLIADNQVVIVVGETGSGKTTQLTQYLLEEKYCPDLTDASGKRVSMMIGCTQPRRVAAVSVAKRVSEELGCALGTTVGYAIRFEDCTSSETKIKYMTDGVLLRECLRDPDIDAYSAIIIDEAHERSLQTDILLGILREIVRARRRLDLKIIVTSATMDARKFSDFFCGAPIFHIPGRTFPVQMHYASSVPEDYVDASVKQVLSLHASAPPGDILVFMTGQEDIAATCQAVEERLREKPMEVAETLHVLPIYSQLPADLQAKIFAGTPEGHRKCIVATNIAETSLTVDGIVYVVDCGLCKLKVYNPRIGMDALQLAPISQAAAQQRAGRAGRTGPGHCYRMYPPRAFAQELFPNNIPEIARTNLANAVLLLKSLKVEDILSFAFMDAPSSDALVAALFQLWALGALDDERGELTRLGHRLVDFPLDPPLAKMLLVADALGCVKEILSIVSMLSVPAVFHRPREQLELSDARRERFLVAESDHLTLLQVYDQWLKTPEHKREAWCQYHFVQPKSLLRAHHIREQLCDILVASKVDPTSSCGSDVDRVLRTIASAHVAKAAKLKGFGQYVNLRSGLPCALHPTSSLGGLSSSPEYVVFHELLLTSREYMQGVTAVRPEWLAEAGPAFYSLRVSHGPNAIPRIVNFADADTPLRHAGFRPAPTASSSVTTTPLNAPATLSAKKKLSRREEEEW